VEIHENGVTDKSIFGTRTARYSDLSNFSWAAVMAGAELRLTLELVTRDGKPLRFSVRPGFRKDDDPRPGEHWIIGDAAPADIPRLDGIPTVVLSAPRIRRTFKAPRDFDELHGDVRLVATLEPTEVRARVQRAAAGA
jgi:hypothetical protein